MKTELEGVFIIFLLSLSCLFCISCSKEDDFYDHKFPQEIVGIWKPTIRIDICPSQPDKTYSYSNCQQKATIEFLNDGKYSQKYYSYTEAEGCQLTGEITGSWYVHKDNILVIYRPIGFGAYQDYTFCEVESTILKLGDSNLYSCDGAKGYVEYTRI